MGKYSRVDVIRNQVSEILKGTYTMLPAIVKKYDPVLQVVTVTVAISQNIDLAATTPAPILSDVPVMFPFGGSFRMGWTLAEGDNVLILFAQKSLEEWRASTGLEPVTPVSTRKHNLSDGIAIAGITTTTTRDERFKGSPHIADDETYIVFNRVDPEGEELDDGLYIETNKDIHIVAKGNCNVTIEGSTTINTTGTTNIISGEGATVKAPSVFLDTETTQLSGDLFVDGAISSGGLITSAVNVLAPVAYVSPIGDGDVPLSGDTKSLKDHTHDYTGTTESGAPNSEHDYSGTTTIPTP